MEILLLVAVGAAAGIASALFGIGGGLLTVPFMVLVLGFDQHLAQGTSLAVIVPTAVAGAIAHHKRGFVDLHAAALIACGGVAGVLGGARLALAVPASTLRLYFGLVVVALGIRLVAQGAAAERRERADRSG